MLHGYMAIWLYAILWLYAIWLYGFMALWYDIILIVKADVAASVAYVTHLQQIFYKQLLR